MKKAKLIKTISLMSCGLVATGSIPALMTSCSKTDDQYKPQNEQVVFEQMTAQIDAVLTQLSQMISETSAIGDQTKQVCLQVINSFQSTVVKQLKDLSTDPRINVVETMDPLEIFQQVLVFFHAPVMGAISTFFNSYIINKILGHDRAQSYIQLFEDITTNKIDLEIYAKTHWSLTDIFENILYPLCGSAFDEEAARQIAWKLIFKFYSDTYYSGINYDHTNGREIQGEYKLLAKPEYTDQFDWANVRRGDIMFSGYGFNLGGLYSGHCGIVEGWETGVTKDGETVKYLRVIEANQFGVCYNLVDDYRVENDALTILHISNASAAQEEAAVKFCENQLGKPYSIPLFLSEDVNPDAGAWYCSELVWAAYMNQGINIQSNQYYKADIPGILPWEILYYDHAEPIIQHFAGF